ncbi:ATP-binding protein [Kitasatospora griseola]|uniref:ATP-binding protein n=1 Tax=Kitasatospora griseola TaxID=2064 RepID=UPI00364C52CA
MATFFVDRAEHMAASGGFLRSVAEGQGGVLVIQGEQGIGKSALLREIVRSGGQASGDEPECRFVQARCLDRIGTENAYGPIVDILTLLQPPRRSFLRRLGRSTVNAAPELVSLVPTLGPLLKTAAQVVQSAIDSPSAQPDSMAPLMQSVARAVAGALEDAAADGGPTVIVLDDVQWLDPSSLLVLEHFVERLYDTEISIGVILGCRSGPGNEVGAVPEALARWELAGWCTRSRLAGLPHDAVETLVQQHHSGPVAASLSARVSELTKGHPVFVTQCLRMVGANGDLQGPLPDTVGPLIRRRLSGLDEETLDLLIIGATQGETFDSVVVAKVSGHPVDRVAGRLHQLSRRQGLVQSVPPPAWAQDESADYYCFENALLHMAVLDERSAGQARDGHGRIAAALAGEGAEHAELSIPVRLEIARHYRLAHRWDDAARTQFALARELAVSGMSFSEAEALSKQAVESTRKLSAAAEDRDLRLARAIELLLSLTEARWQGRPGAAETTDLEAHAQEAEDAARRSGDAEMIVRALLMHGRVLLKTKGLQPCLEKLQDAVRLAQEGSDPALLFAARSAYGGQLTKRDLATGLREQLEAEEQYEHARAQHDAKDRVRHVLNISSELQLGVNLFDAGYLDRAKDRLSRCVERLRHDPVNNNLPVALNYLSQLHIAMGSEDEASDALREAREFDERLGGASGWHAYNTALLALVLSHGPHAPGQRHRSRSLIEEAWRETEHTWLLDLVPIVRNLYAEVVMNISGNDPDDLAFGIRLTAETVRETSRTGMVRSEVAALSLQSRLRLKQRNAAEAGRLARAAVEILDEVGDLPALRTEEVLHHAAVALRAAGCEDEADGLARRAREEVTRKANLIDSLTDRERFLRDVPLNRAILGSDAQA